MSSRRRVLSLCRLKVSITARVAVSSNPYRLSVAPQISRCLHQQEDKAQDSIRAAYISVRARGALYRPKISRDRMARLTEPEAAVAETVDSCKLRHSRQ